jgi:hypothetical protein
MGDCAHVGASDVDREHSGLEQGPGRGRQVAGEKCNWSMTSEEAIPSLIAADDWFPALRRPCVATLRIPVLVSRWRGSRGHAYPKNRKQVETGKRARVDDEKMRKKKKVGGNRADETEEDGRAPTPTSRGAEVSIERGKRGG